MDILERYKNELDFEGITLLRQQNNIELEREHWSEFLELYNALPILNRKNDSNIINQDSKIIDVTLNILDKSDFNKIIESLIPWRKGPFKVFDVLIDAEWQSWMKWERLAKALPDISNLKIADVGSGNGYFMFQLAKSNPELVLGFERSPLAVNQFKFLQYLARQEALQLELIDSDGLPYFKNFFDIVVCMGVAYHTRNPMLLLENINISLKSGGKIFLESQIWPGEGSYCFFNAERYAKIKNVFFVPTIDALVAWIRRSGFKKVEVISVDKTTIEEQRKTKYSPFESLIDYLDPQNHELTIEGHPAPIRALVRAEKV